ncbi:hypothetical protein OXIME_000651 [Oxyplasma meridianum]|uniref:Uncharacterized protein n=1 Tax=Oxyplasma meridianum TaxID=3073602 RepID=A0AAX4NH69_9ARCH
MKNQNNNAIAHFSSNLLNSGSLSIKFNGEAFARVNLNQGDVDILLENGERAKKLSKVMPHSLKKMKTMHLISRITAKIGITVTVSDQKGLILKLGRGVHSIMGNFEVKITRIGKYL